MRREKVCIIIEKDVEIAIRQADSAGFIAGITSTLEQFNDPYCLKKSSGTLPCAASSHEYLYGGFLEMPFFLEMPLSYELC